jgi:hypothetical protein
MKYIKNFIKICFLIAGIIAAICYLLVWIGMLMRPGVIPGFAATICVGVFCLIFIKIIKWSAHEKS